MFQRSICIIFLSISTLISCSFGEEQPQTPSPKTTAIAVPEKGEEVSQEKEEDRIRVGYFHGGRVHTLYRALIYNWLEREGAIMDLHASYLHDQMNFKKVPKDVHELTRIRYLDDFGRTKGTAIVDAMMNGDLEGGTIGESSFIDAVQKGYPIIAVAELGHDFMDLPGKVILTRPGFNPKTAEDLRGKVLVTRRAGPGDAAFLKEYLLQNGLVPGKDVTVIDQVTDHYQMDWLSEGKVDGGLYHLWGIRKLVDKGKANIFRRMDWFNPELSQAVLVFRKDVIEERPDEIQKIIDGYTKRLIYEDELSIPEKTHFKPRGPYLGLVIYLEYRGMRMPAATYPPLVELNLLDEMQDMLVRHDVYDKSVVLKDHIDNRFVQHFMDRYAQGEIEIPREKDPRIVLEWPEGVRAKDKNIDRSETPESFWKKRQAEIAAEKAARNKQ